MRVTMHADVHTLQHHIHPHVVREPFYISFFNRSKKVLKIMWKELRIFYIIAYVFYFLQEFILGFVVTFEKIVNSKGEMIPLSLGLLKPVLIVYLVGTFLTPLPSFIVIPLSLATFYFGSQKVMPLLGIVMVYTFFNALII